MIFCNCSGLSVKSVVAYWCLPREIFLVSHNPDIQYNITRSPRLETCEGKLSGFFQGFVILMLPQQQFISPSQHLVVCQDRLVVDMSPLLWEMWYQPCSSRDRRPGPQGQGDRLLWGHFSPCKEHEVSGQHQETSANSNGMIITWHQDPGQCQLPAWSEWQVLGSPCVGPGIEYFWLLSNNIIAWSLSSEPDYRQIFMKHFPKRLGSIHWFSVIVISSGAVRSDRARLFASMKHPAKDELRWRKHQQRRVEVSVGQMWCRVYFLYCQVSFIRILC